MLVTAPGWLSADVCSGSGPIMGFWVMALLWQQLMALAAAEQVTTDRSKASSHSEEYAATCKPVGLLNLEAPYPPPRLTGQGLPICPQFSCSCCARPHVLAILRSLAPGVSSITSKGAVRSAVAGSGGLSSSCTEATLLMGCRICDPQVGMGLKPAVCSTTCDSWHAACAEDYFTFDVISGQLLPCAVDGPLPGAPPCSKLEDMADSGQAMCELAGFPIAEPSSGSLCYDGTDPLMPPGVCQPDEGQGRAARPATTRSDLSLDMSIGFKCFLIAGMCIAFIPRMLSLLRRARLWAGQGQQAQDRRGPRFARTNG